MRANSLPLQAQQKFVCSDHFRNNAFNNPADRDNSHFLANACPSLMLHLFVS
jgi:hypothetical protein